jgi:uncharacterized membrane protein HdeD (DUF308 family)
MELDPKTKKILCAILGVAFVILALVIILSLTIAYFYIFYSFLFEEISVFGVIWTILGLFVLFNMMFNYASAIFVDPG